MHIVIVPDSLEYQEIEDRVFETKCRWGSELRPYMYKDKDNNTYYKFPSGVIKNDLVEAWCYMKNNTF